MFSWWLNQESNYTKKEEIILLHDVVASTYAGFRICVFILLMVQGLGLPTHHVLTDSIPFEHTWKAKTGRFLSVRNTKQGEA